MDMCLQGKKALVTGANSGIGHAIALALAREGAQVAVHARTQEKAQAVMQEIIAEGGQACAVSAELTDVNETLSMCERALVELGVVDIVVNNAGVFAHRPLLEDGCRVLGS